jgi:hypothetical protein
MNNCLYFAQAAGKHLTLAGSKYLELEILHGTLEVFTFLHMAPVALEQCYLLRAAYNDLNVTVHQTRNLADTVWQGATSRIT